MNLYLAADFARHAEIERYAQRLRDLGHVVTSRWHAAAQPGASLDTGTGCPPVEVGEVWATADLEDLQGADALVLFTTGRQARGGRHVEFGVALGLKKALFLVGPRETCYHCLPWVEQFKGLEGLIRYLGATEEHGTTIVPNLVIAE